MMRAEEGHIPSLVGLGELYYFGQRGLERYDLLGGGRGRIGGGLREQWAMFGVRSRRGKKVRRP